MLPSVDIKLDIKQLKDRPILSEILQILKMIRPKWLPQDIRHTVRLFEDYSLFENRCSIYMYPPMSGVRNDNIHHLHNLYAAVLTYIHVHCVSFKPR